MLKRVAILLCAAAVSASAYAQEPKPAAAAKPPSTNDEQVKPETKKEPAAKPVPEPPPQPINVKIEMSITDQSGANPPAKKMVSMIVGDRQRNSIRSSASVRVPIGPLGPAKAGETPIPTNFSYRNVTINVDAHPTIVQKEPNKVLLEFVIQYAPKSGGGQEDLEPGMASLNESMTVVLESGKPMIVSQAADPTSDRKITVEVTATILK